MSLLSCAIWEDIFLNISIDSLPNKKYINPNELSVYYLSFFFILCRIKKIELILNKFQVKKSC